MPLDVDRRVRRYLDQTGRRELTARQARRAQRKERRDFANDIDATGSCCCNGCIGEGPCDLDLGRSDEEDWGCCALDEGHGGPCQWRCSDCGGDGNCLACRGDGEDGSGLPGTCMECGGSGRCPAGCDEGCRPMSTEPLPERTFDPATDRGPLPPLPDSAYPPDARPIPPDDRLDGPIHSWFGLTYSNYLVLHRTMMQSMPVAWQERAVTLLDELDQAFAHIERTPSYIVRPARESEYGALSDAEMKLLDVTCSSDEPDPEHDPGVFYDADGDEHEPWERVLVPSGADPVAHYNRGRTYIPPDQGVCGACGATDCDGGPECLGATSA